MNIVRTCFWKPLKPILEFNKLQSVSCDSVMSCLRFDSLEFDRERLAEQSISPKRMITFLSQVTFKILNKHLNYENHLAYLFLNVGNHVLAFPYHLAHLVKSLPYHLAYQVEGLSYHLADLVMGPFPNIWPIW